MTMLIVSRDCFECELLPVFSRVGAIYEHRLMMEQNGLNRGYAYVKFTNVQVSRVPKFVLSRYYGFPLKYNTQTRAFIRRLLPLWLSHFHFLSVVV